MTSLFPKMTRRSFLSLVPAGALAPIGGLAFATEGDRYHYQYDHILGTSMDLAVWSRDSTTAGRAHDAALNEIMRLNAILNTRDSSSEISRLGESASLRRSRDLDEMFAAYDYWERKTGGLLSIRPSGPDSPRNVDALGKAYILDRAVAAARYAAPAMDGLLLNIGGDIVAWGNSQEIHIADPCSPQDNALPIAKIDLRNAAIATSGTYARGAHLLDARTGRPAPQGVSASVIAPNAVIANALATTLCVTDADEGLRLVESTPGAEALRIDPNGVEWRTTGFARLEKPRLIRTAAAADWPMGFELTVALVVKPGESDYSDDGQGGKRALPRPYIAVWVEDSAGKVVKVMAFWANKAEFYKEMSTFYRAMGRNQTLIYAVARATRAPGSYFLIWDGLDAERKPLPLGTYKIVVEADQEHGDYSKQSGMLALAEMPASLTLSATSNFEPVKIQYGPRQNRA